jgi:hypothetical protein
VTAAALRRLAWALWGLALALVAGAHVLRLPGGWDTPLFEFWLESTVIGPSFAILGLAIILHRPRNAIGWIFCAGGIIGGLQFLLGQYASVTLADAPDALAGRVAGALSESMQISTVGVLLFLILLFPEGSAASRRERVLGLALATFIILGVASNLLSAGALTFFPDSRNPFGVAGADPVFTVVDLASGILGFFGVFGVIASAVVRFRASRGIERQQLKWFAYAPIVSLAAILSAGAVESDQIGAMAWTFAALTVPIAAAIAITRYRLYEIDRLVNRTLVYVALTAILAAAYLGIVVALQNIIPGADDSDLTIAGSTLAVAALFRPLRGRVQGFIDRRFYRGKYDTQRTLQSFSSRLREDVDLDHLRADLLGVVRETMQPAHASLWLRIPGEGR